MQNKYPFYYYLILFMAFTFAVVFWYWFLTDRPIIVRQHKKIVPHAEIHTDQDTVISIGPSHQFAT